MEDTMGFYDLESSLENIKRPPSLTVLLHDPEGK